MVERRCLGGFELEDDHNLLVLLDCACGTVLVTFDESGTVRVEGKFDRALGKSLDPSRGLSQAHRQELGALIQPSTTWFASGLLISVLWWKSASEWSTYSVAYPY